VHDISRATVMLHQQYRCALAYAAGHACARGKVTSPDSCPSCADAADGMPVLLLLLLQAGALTPLLSMRCLRLPVYSRDSSLYIPLFRCIQQPAAVAGTTQAAQHHAGPTVTGCTMRWERN
jgi:hypothetical protein